MEYIKTKWEAGEERSLGRLRYEDAQDRTGSLCHWTVSLLPILIISSIYQVAIPRFFQTSAISRIQILDRERERESDCLSRWSSRFLIRLDHWFTEKSWRFFSIKNLSFEEVAENLAQLNFWSKTFPFGIWEDMPKNYSAASHSVVSFCSMASSGYFPIGNCYWSQPLNKSQPLCDLSHSSQPPTFQFFIKRSTNSFDQVLYISPSIDWNFNLKRIGHRSRVLEMPRMIFSRTFLTEQR